MKRPSRAALGAALSAWMVATAQAAPAPNLTLADPTSVIHADNPCGPSNPCGPGKKKKKKDNSNLSHCGR
jgi:hypothetical protein